MFITFSIPNQCFTILSADDLISSKYLYPFSLNTRDSDVGFTYWPYALLELKDAFFPSDTPIEESHTNHTKLCASFSTSISFILPSLCLMPLSHSSPFLPWPLRALVHTLPWTPFLPASPAFTLTLGQWQTSAGLPSQNEFFPPPPLPQQQWSWAPSPYIPPPPQPPTSVSLPVPSHSSPNCSIIGPLSLVNAASDTVDGSFMPSAGVTGKVWRIEGQQRREGQLLQSTKSFLCAVIFWDAWQYKCLTPTNTSHSYGFLVGHLGESGRMFGCGGVLVLPPVFKQKVGNMFSAISGLECKSFESH